MFKWVICLFLPSFLSALSLSEKKLEHMLENPPPEWMSAQIEEDLAPFRETGVTQEMLDQTLAAFREIPTGYSAMLIRYKIENNEVSFTTTYRFLEDIRIIGFMRFLKEMTQYVDLPDVEFIMSLADSYDRPLYVSNTHCPIFTVCKLKHNHTAVLLPEVRIYKWRQDLYNIINKEATLKPWNGKTNKAFWCGRTTGGFYGVHEWDLHPRPRLLLFSQDNPDLLEAYFTYPTRVNDQLKPLFESEGYFQPFTSPKDSMRYKYLIAVDGVSFPSSFWWQLLTNCTVIKGNSDYIEWFYRGLEPYVHYLPYDQACSDLEEKIRWLQENDAQAQKIAENGHSFALDYLGNEGMILYYYTLFHAYAKLQR